MNRNQAIAHVLQHLQVEVLEIDARSADEVKFLVFTPDYAKWRFTLPAPIDLEVPQSVVDSHLKVWAHRARNGECV